jgi:hypothetical protein
MTKTFGFAGVALVAGVVAYFGGLGTLGGVARLAFFLSTAFALIFLLVERGSDRGAQ